MSLTRSSSYDPVAVIDIGSNSIRLVIYDQPGRSPYILLNDKEMCELGRGVAITGFIDAETNKVALATMRGFKIKIDIFGCQRIFVIATAAVREARNSSSFIKRIEAIIGVRVRVISGEVESHLAGLGIIAGFSTPDGIGADFGGGSLELCDIKDTGVSKTESYKLGSLRLLDLSDNNPKKAVKIVSRKLAASSTTKKATGRNIYAIGGAWRSIAKAHMAKTNYSLPIVHNYEIEAEQCLDFCNYILKNEDHNGSFANISASRRQLMPFGAATLKALLQICLPKRVFFSTYGIREGIIFEQLPVMQQQMDPLLASSIDLAASRSRSPEYGAELLTWIDELFALLEVEESPQLKRLRHAACLLADIDWRLHPDYSGSHVVSMVAYGSFSGLDHKGRIYLAIASYVSYEGELDSNFPKQFKKIIDDDATNLAIITGLAIRAANTISFLVPGILKRIKIKKSDQKRAEANVTTIKLPCDLRGINNDRIGKRFNKLAKAVRIDDIIVV